MLISVSTVFLFAIGMVGLLLYPKAEGKLNGAKMIVMGIMAVFSYLALLAFLYDKIGVPINLQSTCVSLLIMNLFLWGGIVYKRKVQKLFWRASELICLFVLGGFVVWLAVYMFTPELQLQYYNVDAASHYLYANLMLQTEKINMYTYFSAFINATCMELFSPLLVEVTYYKAFMIADVFMHVLEVWMFYYLVLTISEQKIVKVLAPIITLGYFWGYPAYSYMEGHFVYWSNGVMIYIFILYTLLLIEKNRAPYRYTIPLLFLGLYANTCCNKLFVPTNTLAVMAVLVIIFGARYWKKINKKMLLIVVIGCGLILAVVGGMYLYLWKDVFATLLEDLRVEGGLYSSLFADIIFFLPAWIYIAYYTVKKECSQKTVLVSSLCMVAITLGMYLLKIMGYMSWYYYYKIYYNLWLSCWLIVVVAIELMAKKKQLAWCFSYLGMVFLIAWITLSDYDTKIAEVHEDYNSWKATTQMFSLYNYNADKLRMDYSQFRITEQKLDVFNYVLNEMADVNVQIVTDNFDLWKWHNAIDLIHLRGYHFEEYELTDLLMELDETGVQAIIVDRSEEKYGIYSDYFGRCREVYSNGNTAVLMPVGERWMEISEDAYLASEEKQELYAYVRDELEAEKVPLLASQGAYYDYMFYYMMTLNSPEGFYTWRQMPSVEEMLTPEEELQLIVEMNLQNLKNNEIQYIMFLYEDAFYQQAGVFFDEMRVVYENGAGKIIALEAEDK